MEHLYLTTSLVFASYFYSRWEDFANWFDNSYAKRLMLNIAQDNTTYTDLSSNKPMENVSRYYWKKKWVGIVYAQLALHTVGKISLLDSHKNLIGGRESWCGIRWRNFRFFLVPSHMVGSDQVMRRYFHEITVCVSSGYYLKYNWRPTNTQRVILTDM